MKKINYLIILIAFLFCISCRKKANEVIPVLKQAEAIMEQNPDSALVLLNRISNVEKLNMALKNKHYLMLVEAKDKCYKDITSDTLIFKVRDYYLNFKDNDMIALSAFYCGRVLQAQKKYDDALLMYITHEAFFEQNKNYKLQGLYNSSIGSIYYWKLLCNKAIVHFQKAEVFFNKAKNIEYAVAMYSSIGNCFLIEGKTDSAFVNYKEALLLSDKYNLPKEKVRIYQNMGVAFNLINDSENSEKYLHEAFHYSTDSIEKSKILYNLSDLFIKKMNYDSATYYFNKSFAYLSNQSDNNFIAEMYRTWSNVEEKNKTLKMLYKNINSIVIIFL